MPADCPAVYPDAASQAENDTRMNLGVGLRFQADVDERADSQLGVEDNLPVGLAKHVEARGVSRELVRAVRAVAEHLRIP